MPRTTKAALIAGCVVLSVQCAAPGAHADTLPKEMLGKWCGQSGGDEQNNTFYERGKCGEGKDLAYGMTLHPNAIEYWEEGCTFASITPRVSTYIWIDDKGKWRKDHGKTYEIKAKCAGMEEHWNTTIWLTYWADGGRMEHISYVDNELPFDTSREARVFCQYPADKYGPVPYYMENPADGCKSKVTLTFEKDHYTITRNEDQRGFCRFASINSVWDPNLGVSTKDLGGPVTYITSQCPLGQTKLKVFWSKGSMYMEDVK
jgi:hypothetical protein